VRFWQLQLTTIERSRLALGLGTVEMGLLANFKIRTKVLVALLPLAVMVIVAALYSSSAMKSIDTRYSDLLDKDVKALQDLTAARALDNRFGLYLYKQIPTPCE